MDKRKRVISYEQKELVELFDKHSDLSTWERLKILREVTGSMLPKKHYQ
jgi:hypothetical protein